MVGCFHVGYDSPGPGEVPALRANELLLVSVETLKRSRFAI